MSSYYDYILAAIPLAMIGFSGVLVFGGINLTTAIPVASVITVGLMGHAMFIRAPVEVTPTRDTNTESETNDTSVETTMNAPVQSAD